MEPTTEPVVIVPKRSSSGEQSFKPSSCPVGSSPVSDKLKSSGSSPDKLKRAGSITDVATKQGHSRTQVSLVAEALLGTPGERTRITQRPFSPSSQKESHMSDSTEWGGVIHGHYLNVNDDFENVESPYGSDNHTDEVLQRCKRTVLYPYLVFQKLIGWRRLFSSSHDLEMSKVVKCANVLYPAGFFVILVYTCVSQLLTCFFRTDAISSNGSISNITVMCREKLVTLVFLSDGVLLVVYLWGVYLFLYLEPEYLSSLMERVFISCTSGSQTKLVHVLQVTLASGGIWVTFSLVTSIMRMFSLNLLRSGTVIDWLAAQADDTQRNTLVISALVGFLFFDLLYISVVIYYISQGELIITLLKSIRDKVRNKKGSLDEAIKDINYTHTILHIFNGQLSAMTSLCLFIFVVQAITSYKNLLEVPNESHLAYAVGVCNMIQWSFIIVGPVFQAARLTRECRHLKRLGLEIAARPYIYSDTPQRALDSFLLYTNSTNYSAKLIGVPIYPKYIVLGLFVFGLFLSLYDFPLTWWF